MDYHRRYRREHREQINGYARRYRKLNHERIARINHRHYVRGKDANRQSRAKSRLKWNAEHPDKQKIYRRRSALKRFIVHDADRDALDALRKVQSAIMRGHLSLAYLSGLTDWQGDYRVRFIYRIVPNEPLEKRDEDLRKINQWLKSGYRRTNR